MDRIKYIRRVIERANKFMTQRPENFEHAEIEDDRLYEYKALFWQTMGRKKKDDKE